ncbi:hypothetical protein [Streptomyces sp. NPDC015131]|uniref:hypothetical protein n=1 Tax=Streptomyces sp. NPDC015131 TaxID=3364941 RepID=UPI0036FC7747
MRHTARLLAVAMAVLTGATACGGGTDAGPQGTPGKEPGKQPGTQRGTQPVEQSGPLRLTTPDTLAGGRYTRETDAAGPDPTLAEVMAAQVEDARPAFGAYRREGDVLLTVTGVHGTVPAPARARARLDEVLDERDGARTLIAPRTIVPPGTDQPVVCRVVERHHQSLEVDLVAPSCTWADAWTVAEVSRTLPPDTAPTDVDLDAFAAETAAVRREVRRP